jgi:excisionase family DNA binding protein
MSIYRITEGLLVELDEVLQQNITEDKACFQKMSLDQLEVLHFHASKTLSHLHKLETITTRFERNLEIYLKSLSRYQFYTGFWIGRHCVDLFFPRYGLIVEVDGGIHNEEIKMRKDEHRDEYFRGMGLSVTHAENAKIWNFTQTFLTGIRDGRTKQLDTRSTRKNMRDIYIKTIVRNKDFLRTQIWNWELTKGSGMKDDLSKLTWMNSDDAAEYLRISKSRLHNLTSSGELKYYKLGRSNRYLKEDLDRFLSRQVSIFYNEKTEDQSKTKEESL